MPYIDYVNESMRSPEQELEDLKRANRFTDADLALNRVGKIGNGQIPRLIRPILQPLVKGGFTRPKRKGAAPRGMQCANSGPGCARKDRKPTGMRFATLRSM